MMKRIEKSSVVRCVFWLAVWVSIWVASSPVRWIGTLPATAPVIAVRIESTRLLPPSLPR